MRRYHRRNYRAMKSFKLRRGRRIRRLHIARGGYRL